MKQLIFQSLKTRRIQTVAVCLTVAVSIMAFVSLFLLYGGMQRGVELSRERSGAEVLVIPWKASEHLTESELLFTGAPVAVYMNAGIADKIAAIDGVADSTAQFYGQSLAESCCSTAGEIRVIGIDTTSTWLIGSYTDYDLTGGLGTDEIIIGCNVNGFDSGSGSLLGSKMQVVARLGASGTELDNAVLIDIDRIRQMVAATPQLQHYWDEYGSPSTLISAVLLNYEEGAEPYIVKNKIEALGVKVVERSEVVDSTTEQLSVVFTIMFAAGLILTLASLLQFMARFYSLVWERKAEMALYRALGATQKDLKLVIGGEAFLITAVGALIGTALGLGLYSALLSFLTRASAFPFAAFPPWAAALGILAIVALFFVFAALSIIMPLRQINRIDPASAMQQVDIG